MSREHREPVTVSFTHISEDVIVPSDKIKGLKGKKSIYTSFFLFFGACWIAMVIAEGLQGVGIFITLPILMIIAYLMAKGTTNVRWIEIERKQGAINSWTNSKKKKQLPPIKKENVELFYQKVSTGNRYGTRVFKIFVKGAVNGKIIEHVLYIFPDKTDEQIVKALTAEVSHFIHNFLDGKPVQTDNQEYKFVRPV